MFKVLKDYFYYFIFNVIPYIPLYLKFLGLFGIVFFSFLISLWLVIIFQFISFFPFSRILSLISVYFVLPVVYLPIFGGLTIASFPIFSVFVTVFISFKILLFCFLSNIIFSVFFRVVILRIIVSIFRYFLKFSIEVFKDNVGNLRYFEFKKLTKKFKPLFFDKIYEIKIKYLHLYYPAYAERLLIKKRALQFKLITPTRYFYKGYKERKD
jgi:hypothetical protein